MARYYTYDSAEDISRCLNCQKKECTNCLGQFYSAHETAEQLDESEENGNGE